jgi:hypothetical protein
VATNVLVVLSMLCCGLGEVVVANAVLDGIHMGMVMHLEAGRATGGASVSDNQSYR